MADPIPKVAYMCPHCKMVSATINRVETVETVTPHSYETYTEHHHPDVYHVTTRQRMSRWECALCGREIDNVERCLGELSFEKFHPDEDEPVDEDGEPVDIEPIDTPMRR